MHLAIMAALWDAVNNFDALPAVLAAQPICRLPVHTPFR